MIYESNIAFSTIKKSEYDKRNIFFRRYIAAHTIMISFDGIPAIYFNSLFGTSNDEANDNYGQQ